MTSYIVGLLSMEDVISHEQDRVFSCRSITARDWAEWPHIASDSAGRPENGRVFIGPTKSEARALKSKHITFADSQRPSSSCKCATFSHNGKILAASFDSNNVLVWRVSDGLLVQRLHHRGHAEQVYCLSFSPTEYSIVSGSEDATAIIWDVRSGHVLLRLEGHGGTVRRVEYAPHGRLIATSCSDDRSLKIWDASTGQLRHSFSADQRIFKLVFSPDSSRLYAELRSSCLIYDMDTYTHTATIEHEVESMLNWSLSRQGDRIVTGSREPGQVKIWDAVTGKELLAIGHPVKLSYPVAFSPDGTEVLAACDADKTALTYDSQTGQLRRVFELSEEPTHVTYSPNGGYLALRANRRPLQVYAAKSGTFLAEFEWGEDDRMLEETHFLPDCQALLTRFSRGPLVLCNIHDVMRMR
ncbi:uncharacterized protein PHACADRAFT_248976 [Phanerochaete carnosa HHB-10118-sp]|uniref:Uncharacterized protein n=1 Tax=Phanerochaete carnosa (strain HHB-10118-sp) TaxID=650164 RepID=K5WIF7_PHACS|nr:uncharacterized protein PHACADRAFT_248976 [Phanerochaete carnosa HHB-10118-sp]EKM58874.1 hypothetical protein PHACADRAFT_248976 [Phanerochaete carnosa HHB-10118-sp]